MSYIVTWWEGNKRCHLVRNDVQAAQETALTLRRRSDMYTDRSIVPIRVIEDVLWERMQALEKAHNATMCRHGLLRLCLKCLKPGA